MVLQGGALPPSGWGLGASFSSGSTTWGRYRAQAWEEAVSLLTGAAMEETEGSF